MSPSMLTVGLDPALVDDAPSSRAAFPELDAEAVRAGVAAERARLAELGITVDVCLLDYGRTAEAVYRAALSRKDYDIVMIGAGCPAGPGADPALRGPGRHHPRTGTRCEALLQREPVDNRRGRPAVVARTQATRLVLHPDSSISAGQPRAQGTSGWGPVNFPLWPWVASALFVGTSTASRVR